MNAIEPQATSLLPGSADIVFNALPHPVLMVAPDGRIAEANVAAEDFFEISVPVLRRHVLRDLVPFGSPLLALIEQVRGRAAPVNEYRVDLGTPRNSGERIVDLHVAPVPERRDHVVVMLLERTIADGAFGQRAGGDARARDQEPTVRHSRRRPIARAIGRR